MFLYVYVNEVLRHFSDYLKYAGCEKYVYLCKLHDSRLYACDVGPYTCMSYLS